MKEVDMANIIDGKEIAKQVRREVRQKAAQFAKAHGRAPGLAVILVGDDPASCIYVSNKQKACEKVGIAGQTLRLPEKTSTEELIDEIERLNRDPATDGILVQLPLPRHIDEKAALDHILPIKDVDGLHPDNAGRLLSGRALLEPCTPRGCMELLKRSGIPIAGKNAVVIGRSALVGKPAALMLLRENATVTLCHSKTAELKQYTSMADIVIAATGKPGLIKGEMLKPGCALIDVGINRLADGSICGDADYDSAVQVAGWITPVPGGVGPMTIAMLLDNTLIAAEAQNA